MKIHKSCRRWHIAYPLSMLEINELSIMTLALSIIAQLLYLEDEDIFKLFSRGFSIAASERYIFLIFDYKIFYYEAVL